MIGTDQKRIAELREGIARTQERLRLARKQLDRSDATAGNSDVERRTRRKLQDDFTRAENDEEVLQRALREASRVAA